MSDTSEAWYKKWWVWMLIIGGILLLAGVGVAIFFVVSREQKAKRLKISSNGTSQEVEPSSASLPLGKSLPTLSRKKMKKN